MKWESIDTSVNPRALFELVTYDFTEIVKEIEVQFSHKDKHGNQGTVIKLDGIMESVQEQRHRDLGRCYTFRPGTSIRKLGIDSIKTSL